MIATLVRPFTFLLAMGVLILLALSGPASSEGYGDPAIVPEQGALAVEPGAEFTVGFRSNVECSWSATFEGQDGPGAVGFDYEATFTAPTADGTYEGTVVCRYSTAGPFRPIAYSADATYAATRDQTISQTFTVVVGADAGDDDGTTTGASDSDDGALASTGGSSLTLLALGGGLVVVGGAVALAAARRRKSA